MARAEGEKAARSAANLNRRVVGPPGQDQAHPPGGLNLLPIGYSVQLQQSASLKSGNESDSPVKKSIATSERRAPEFKPLGD